MIYNCPLKLSKSVSSLLQSRRAFDKFHRSLLLLLLFLFLPVYIYEKRKNLVNTIVVTIFHKTHFLARSANTYRTRITTSRRLTSFVYSRSGFIVSNPAFTPAVAEFSTVHEAFPRGTRRKAAREEKEKLSERVCR